MARISFKANDLLPAIHDLLSYAHEVDARDKDKVCKFVAHLVANGGNKTKAAISAGYGGPAVTEDGKKRTKQMRECAAASKAQVLLKNDKIRNLYEKFYEQKFLATILRELLTKEHVIYLNYLMFDMYHDDDKKASLAITALQEISKLEGYYAPEKKEDTGNVQGMMEAFVAAKALFKEVKDEQEG